MKELGGIKEWAGKETGRYVKGAVNKDLERVCECLKEQQCSESRSNSGTGAVS